MLTRVLLCLVLVCCTLRADHTFRVAFGSCNRQDLPQPLWEPILATRPDAWIWLGDNIYGDSSNPEVLRQKWSQQKSQPGYEKLRASTTILGTWDDHDYGINDGGKDFEIKAESQQIFLDFLDEPPLSPRRKREGIHASTTLDRGRVEVFLLDIRTHRDPKDTDGDILGEEQWKWLERELLKSTAQVVLICSGTQVLPTQHRFEKWADYPRSRKRLLDLIEKLNRPVILLTGDRHFGEISMLELASGRPLWEITSSGLTHYYKNPPEEENGLRQGERFAALNFGTITFDWTKDNATLAIHGQDGSVERSATVSLKSEPSS